MAEIIMPKMGDAMTEGKVIRWYKKAGDSVKKGEPVLEIETDKVNLDLEAEEDGVIENVEVAEGSMAAIGATLASIGTGAGGGKAKPKASAKAAKADAKPETKPEANAEAKPEPGDAVEKAPVTEEAEDGVAPAAAPGATAPVADKSSPAPAAEAEPQRSGNGHVKSSPLARRMAKELGVELGAVRGSGPGGRIVAADIEKAAKSGPAPTAEQKGSQPKGAQPPETAMQRPGAMEAKQTPLSAMRRTIAKRLAESIGPIPHFFLTMEIDVTDLLALRQQLNEVTQAKASVNDFVVRAAALAILHHPFVNSSFTEEAIVQHGEIHVGIAVATPEGLITPVIRNADRKSVVEIAGEVKLLAEKAKNRKLKPDEYQGSTFTISNLGMFGIDEFTAIINPPNSAILAVGAASPQPAVVDGAVVVRERMKVTMSCDHRVIDGAAGAQYLQTFKQYLEQPLRLVL